MAGKWISEWQCDACHKTGWARGKAKAPAPGHYVLVYRAAMCKACRRPMRPTGKALKVYATVDLL